MPSCLTQRSIFKQIIITATGEQIQSDIVIVATEATALISKYKTTTETKHHSVTNVYLQK
jgi:hypothetical protein